MSGRKCKNCRHWTPYVNGKGEFIYAECHRFPPTAQRVPVPGNVEHLFPAVFSWVKNWSRTDPDDQCGEWKKD